MPYYPDPEDKGPLPYDIESYWEHVVSEYSGIPLYQVYDLDIVDFLYLKRQAFIKRLSETDKGREYLENAKCYGESDADYSGLRSLQERLSNGRVN